MIFKDKKIKNLIRYKKEKLHIFEPGIYRYNGQNIKKDHILPLNQDIDKYNNLIDRYRIKFIDFNETQPRKIKLHKYFHHLNSSQALCINLFFPRRL